MGISKKNRTRLAALKNSHAGERCFILGNGPSLRKTDLSLLKDEVSFGANRLYLLFDEIDFRPTYYCSMNKPILDQFHAEINQLQLTKFINWKARNQFSKKENTLFIKEKFEINDSFQPEITRQIGGGGTVTITNLHLAYYMGFKKVIFIGVDHSFSEKGTPNASIKNEGSDVNHFHPDYFPKGCSWQLPDFEREHIAYRNIKKYFEDDGREIVDATPGGKLPIFKKVDYNSLF